MWRCGGSREGPGRRPHGRITASRRRRELVDPTNGVYRYDQLIVLRTTHMPAVLLEAGSIINRKEELDLAKPQRVALVADAATHAVEIYCNAHSHQIAEAPSHPAHAPVRPAPGLQQ